MNFADIPFSFLAVCVLIELTPGPNMTYLAIVSTVQGRRAGLATVAGITLGLFIVGVVALLGVGTLIAQSPLLYETLRWTGVVYLFWLAWDGWRGGETAAVQADAERQGRGKFFRRGLVTNLLNPKAFVFYVATLPAFIPDDIGSRVMQGLYLTLVYVAVATCIHASIALASARAGALLTNAKTEKLLRRALSALLAVVAVWFAWSTRQS